MKFINQLPSVSQKVWADLQHPQFRRNNNVFSQYGEDIILDFILKNIGTTNQYFVDFGAGDGINLSNSRRFKLSGWNGLMMDGDNKGNNEVKKEFITAENINQLFAKYSVPREFDFLSIDIDGQEYWVLKNLEYEPRVVVCEFNGTIPCDISKTVPLKEDFMFDGSDYYGVSLLALKKLMESKGYTLIFQHLIINAFFIRNDLLDNKFDYPVQYKHQQYHRKDTLNRPWVFV